MKQLILHIPHSSSNIPFKDGYVVSDEILKGKILNLTDWYTDDLFKSPEDISIIADFSRIFCDPERFSIDSEEVMAKFGMGVLYEKSDVGNVIREVSAELRERILKEHYFRHHTNLSKSVAEQLEKNGKALIVDCLAFNSSSELQESIIF